MLASRGSTDALAKTKLSAEREREKERGRERQRDQLTINWRQNVYSFSLFKITVPFS